MNETPLILLVNDDSLAQANTVRILEQAGYRVGQAASGQDGLCMAMEKKPALVMVNASLPDMGGFEFCAQVKANPALVDCFVVLLAGRGTDPSVGNGILQNANDAKADGYLFSPFNNVELLTQVGAFLRIQQSETALRASETRLREVLENSLDVSYKRDLHTNAYEYLSPIFVQISGYTPGEMQTLPMETVVNIIHPEDKPDVDRVIKTALAGESGKSYQVEYRFKHKNGSYRWLHDRFTLIKDAEDQPLAMIGSVSDITERKRSENDLQRYTQTTSMLYELSQQILTNLDLDVIYTKIHQTIEKLMTCEAFTIAILDPGGQAISDVYLWDKDRRFPGEQHYPRGQGLSDYIITSGKPMRVNDWGETYARQTGSGVYGHTEEETKSILAAPLFRSNGACFGAISAQSYLPNQYTAEHEQILVTLTNQVSRAIENTLIIQEMQVELAERSRVEEELRQSETKYRLLAENMADVVWILNLSGKFAYISPSVTRLRGFTPEEEISKSLRQVVTRKSMQKIAAHFPGRLKAFANGDETQRVRTDEIDQFRKDGSIVTTEAVTTLLTDAQGRVTQILGVSRDITWRKSIERAEKNQRTLAEALRDTARALNSTLDFNGVLEEILKNVGRVVPIASANIALLGEHGELHYSHFVGYKEHQILEADLKDVGFSLERSAIYKTAYETGQPLIISDTHSDPRWLIYHGSEWIRSYAVMPIRIKDKVVGFLNLDSPIVGMYTPEHIQSLLAFADQAALAIENAQLYAEVQEYAVTDGLTGVFNRRGLIQIGEREVQRTIRFQHPLAAIMFDIDHFKQVNDTYGHPVGDRILCLLARACRTMVRNVDIVTRYGGDEFIVLLPETDQESAERVAERLRAVVEQTEVSVEADEHLNGKTIRVTISLGIAQANMDSDTIQNLIIRADQALYGAKEAGRNQVKVY